MVYNDNARSHVPNAPHARPLSQSSSLGESTMPPLRFTTWAIDLPNEPPLRMKQRAVLMKR